MRPRVALALSSERTADSSHDYHLGVRAGSSKLRAQGLIHTQVREQGPTETERRGREMPTLALGAVLGALFAYFLDPQSGRRRRATTRDRTLALVRRSGRSAQRAGRAVGAEAYGVAQQTQHREEEPKDYDDATLANKVQTEIFRPAEVPKGQIDVNVQQGVVQLRGEVPRPEMIEELGEQTRRIQGVRDVENLLHLPGTEAPTHQ